MQLQSLERLAASSPTLYDSLSDLVIAIGEEQFGPALARYLHGLCGADHFAAFLLSPDNVRELAASCVEPEHTARDRVEAYVKLGLWRADPAMCQAQVSVRSTASSLIRLDFMDSANTDLRLRVYPHIRDRIVLCGRSVHGSFGLSVLKADPHAPFDADALEQLKSCSGLLVTLLGKHSNFLRRRPNVAQALRSLSDIDACMVATSNLPRREAEVCARIVYGLSSVGIALDLNVSEETVKTYRKRAYHRLQIGSERELLSWYLDRWTSWVDQGLPLAALH